LCLLADVKTLLDIASPDTSQDAKLNLLIKRVSSQIRGELHYYPEWTVYSGERHAVNNRQLLQLNSQPIQAISQIIVEGVVITDYYREPENDWVGMVYRPDGWCGNWHVTGLENDPVAGWHSIVVDYTAGWYLPGDENYEEGESGSLPYELYSAAIQATLEAFNILESGGIGMQDHSESKVKDTFRADQGLSQNVLDQIAPFVRYVVA
jgi:hypothetical protein